MRSEYELIQIIQHYREMIQKASIELTTAHRELIELLEEKGERSATATYPTGEVVTATVVRPDRTTFDEEGLANAMGFIELLTREITLGSGT